MPDIKRYVTVGGTVLAILAIGFIMQRGQSDASRPAQPAAMGIKPAPPVEVSRVVLTSSGMVAPAGSDTAPVAPQAEQTAPELAEDPVTTALNTAPVADTPIAIQPRREPDVASVGAVKPVVSEVAKPAPQRDNFDDQPLAIQTATAQPDTSVPDAKSNVMVAPKPACDPKMKVQPLAAAALVQVSLDATCMPSERVTIHHEGMMFSEVTDAAGHLEVTVPALSQTAVFIASYKNGAGAVASTKVATLANFDRAVVQSTNESAVSIHALEFGADYGDDGHIWAEEPGKIENAATGEGGFLMQLGDPALPKGHVAQVYSFPSHLAENGSEVDLSVEVEVTNGNCGRDIEAQSLQVHTGGKIHVQSLELTMPDCDAVGDFLVLKKLVDDVKVARNY